MTVKLKMDVDKLLLAIGVTEASLQYLKANQIENVPTASGIKFVRQGEVLASLSASYDTLQAVVDGTATKLVIAAVQSEAQKVMKTLGALPGGPAVAAKPPQAADVVTVGSGGGASGSGGSVNVLTKSKPATTPGPEMVATSSTAWPVFDLNKLKSAVPVKLRDATHLYQPVVGSSTGSRYFVIAANDELKVAGRLKGTTLSIRVEGPGLEKHAVTLKANEFEKGKDYWRLHVEVPSPVVVRKSIGAVILGLDMPWKTMLPVGAEQILRLGD